MSFLTTPLELKLCVAEYLDPASAFDFAITNRSHWYLCASLIQKHKRLFTEYQKIDTANAGRLVWTKLEEILNDPSRGWYVRELNLPGGRQTNWHATVHGSGPVNPQAPNIPDTYFALFSAAARKLKDRYPTKIIGQDEDDEIQDIAAYIEESIAQGKDSGIVALLVHHLPKLKILRFTDNVEYVFQTLLEQVAIGYGDPMRAPMMPFQRLESAAVAHWDTEGSCSPRWALNLSCIPSFRRFAAQAIGGLMANRGALLPTKSNTKEIFFMGSMVHVCALRVILGGIKALERFSYDCGGAIVSTDSTFAPKRVIKALAKYQAHSLEELILSYGIDGPQVRLILIILV